MLLHELLTEGRMKRSDSLISGEDTEPVVVTKKSSHATKIANWAKKSGKSEEAVRAAYAKAKEAVDPRLDAKVRFAKVTQLTKQALGL